jgi:two-component sensor histidine kinase
MRIRDYLESLVTNIIDTYRAKQQRIRVETNISEVRLTPKVAIPLGFITSELVSNAFKHAFPSGTDGNISVELQRNAQGYLELRVSDDGTGIPADIELDNLDSLGLMLIRTFVSQLNGTYTIENGTGATWIIRFEAPEMEPEAD